MHIMQPTYLLYCTTSILVDSLQSFFMTCADLPDVRSPLRRHYRRTHPSLPPP